MMMGGEHTAAPVRYSHSYAEVNAIICASIVDASIMLAYLAYLFNKISLV